MRAAFAGLSIAVDGLAPDVARMFAARFAASSTPPHETDDVGLRFVTASADEFPVVPTAGIEETFALTFSPSLAVRGRIVSGTLQNTDGRVVGSLRIAPVSPADQLGAVGNMMRIAVAQVVAASGGLLLHSAAIAHGDEAIVLVGRSGAGKSTACTAAKQRGHRVLSDELNALFVDENGVNVCAVPFAGDHGEPPSNDRFRVRGLYLLEQGSDTVAPASRARAVATLVAAAPFVNTDPSRTDALIDTAARIAAATRAQTLALALGSDAWALTETARRSERSS
jgi:hypothetical protein